MNTAIFITLLSIFFLLLILSTIIKDITIKRSGIEIEGNQVYQYIFDRLYPLGRYIKYLYLTLVCMYPQMTVSEDDLKFFAEGDEIQFLANKEAKFGTILMIYDNTLIFKTHKHGGMVR